MTSDAPRLTQFTSILFPTDFSSVSSQVALEVVELCRLFQAKLHILHVIESDAVVSMYGHALDSMRDLDDGVRETLEQRLDEFVQPLRTGQVDITAELRTGTMAEMICSYAAAHGNDLIVMATHGRSGLSHLLLGSVTERVVRLAPVPVLSLKSSDSNLPE